MILADIAKTRKSGQSESEYKAAVQDAVKLLVQIGVFDNLDTNADLVEAVKEIIRKSESHEEALYGEVLNEDQLRAQIEQRENESNELKTQIDELKKTIAAIQLAV